MSHPRLRDDLAATPHEAGGVRYFDIDDPRSGASMRMYEHEWLLARRFDGEATYEEVAGWAQAHVGFNPSAEDLAAYARALAGLGFFDEAGALAGSPEDQASIDVPVSLPPLPAPDETSFEDLNAGPPALDDEIEEAEEPAPLRTLVDYPAFRMQESEPRPGRRSNEDNIPTPLPGSVSLVPERTEPTPLPARLPVTTPPSVLPPPRSDSGLLTPPPEGLTGARDPGLHAAVTPVRQPGPAMWPEAPAPLVVAPPPKARGALGALLLLGAVIVAMVALYWLVIQPALAPVQVRVQAVAPPRDVVHLSDSRGLIKRGAPTTLSFGQAGKVGDIVTAGTPVTPGKTLATLDTYPQLKRELADVLDRESFYENQLKAATAKNRRNEARIAATKVSEKRAVRLDLEEKVARTRIVATTTGSVSDVVAALGSDVEAGAAVLKVVDLRRFVDVKIAPADAALFRAGAVLAAGTADGKTCSVRVSGVEGGVAHVELGEGAPEPPALKDGSELTVVRAKVPHVIPLPLKALAKSQGGADQVFLLTGEVVRARAVTIIERSAGEVLVSGESFSANERIVIDPPPNLQDGQKATATGQ